MKRVKRFLTLVIAMAMVLGMTIPAMAAPAAADGSIEVSNINPDDTVSIYKIIKWDESTGNWALNGTFGNLTVDNLVDNQTTNPDGISIAEAATIAANPGSPVEVNGQTVTTVGTDGKFTAVVAPGMYLVLITSNGSAQDGSFAIYNPIFVSSDYDSENGSHLISVSGDTLLGGSEGIAKKQDLTLDKSVDSNGQSNRDDEDRSSVAVGDIVPFVVTSRIPTYAENYTNPSFAITDTLSSGISMTADQQTAITVEVEGYSGENGERALVNKADVTGDAAWDYEIIDVSAQGYKVSFSVDFLQEERTNIPEVTIKYSATVNENAATHNVDRFTNDVTLEFSNDPTNANSHDTRDDRTNHYTFSINANLNGTIEGIDRTEELVKIGVDEAGNVIESWETTDETAWSGVTQLAGATFSLQQVDNFTDKNPIGQPKTATSGVVDNDNHEADGRMVFSGLDAGNYILKETAAPEGYVVDPREIEVVITANYIEGTDELESYTITINGEDTSTYNVTNSSSTNGPVITTTQRTEGTTTPIINVRGVALPSTGGIGTTIFYVVGAVLVIGAGILLVVKKRMSSR